MKRPSASDQAGVALLLVLWIIVLLAVIANAFGYAMRVEANASGNALVRAQARAYADGGVERALFEYARPEGADGKWKVDGRPHEYKVTDERGVSVVQVRLLDESGKIDLNAAPDALLRGLFVSAGVEDQAAEKLVAAIQDWRDEDDLSRPNGAEAGEYQSAGKKYKPRNAPFDTVEELQWVLGMTPAVFGKIAGDLTVLSRQPGINATFASRSVLLALPGATPEAVDEFIRQRTEALANDQPVPVFPPAMAFPTGGRTALRIRVEVRRNTEAAFVREAVVRPSVDVRRGYTTLYWGEGTL